MANELIEKQKILYNKIMNVLYSEEVESNSEVTSLLNVKNALNNVMSGYNKLLVDNNEKNIKDLNNSLGYGKVSLKNKKLPRVTKIVNYNTDNNNSYIRIFFEDNDFILLGYDKGIKVINTPFELNVTNEFINNNYNMLEANFKTLNSFKTNYPNSTIYFTKEERFINDLNPNNQIIGDGFISCKVNLTSPNSMFATFDDMNDIIVSTLHSNKFGELADYLAMYNDEFLSKTQVNISDLNPLVKSIYDSYIDLNKGKSFTLSK